MGPFTREPLGRLLPFIAQDWVSPSALQVEPRGATWGQRFRGVMKIPGVLDLQLFPDCRHQTWAFRDGQVAEGVGTTGQATLRGGPGVARLSHAAVASHCVLQARREGLGPAREGRVACRDGAWVWGVQAPGNPMATFAEPFLRA